MNAVNGHTPGPWRKSERHECFGCVWTVGAKSFVVADAATNPLPCDEQRANARLIAAAPELLEALQWYVQNDDTNVGQDGNQYYEAGLNRALAAIAKATGASA